VKRGERDLPVGHGGLPITEFAATPCQGRSHRLADATSEAPNGDLRCHTTTL
jgi:hypothetical protein